MKISPVIGCNTINIPDIFLVVHANIITAVRVKELSNTNLFALRHMLREKVSLPVDVRRSETPLLKFPFLCGEEAGEKGKESALSIFSRIAIFIGIPSGSLCGGERSQRENSLRGRRSKGKGKGIRTQANSKMIHASSL